MRRMKSIERRKYPRRQMQNASCMPAILCRSDGSTQLLQLEIVDVSEGGVRVRVDRTLPQDAFNLTIEISHLDRSTSGHLMLPCECVWKRPFSGRRWDYGLEFTSSSVTCEILTDLLKGFTGQNQDLQPL